MNKQFDELTKAMAQSVTRRGALKRVGVGLASMALVAFGLANKAEANGGKQVICQTDSDCGKGRICYGGLCYTLCNTDKDCPPTQHGQKQCCWPGEYGYTGLCNLC